MMLDLLVILAIASAGGALYWYVRPLANVTPALMVKAVPTPLIPAPASSGPYSTPRGVRNRNPGNLRYYKSIAWRGQQGKDDAGYAVFDTFENGIRAATIDLRTGWSYNEDTVTEIIREWAPNHENPTERYIEFVSSRLGVGPNTVLPLSMLPEVLRLICWFENGEPIDKWVTPAQFLAGVQLGLKA